MAALRELASTKLPFWPSWAARVKEGRTPTHAQVLLSSTLPQIAIKLPLPHEQPSWISGIILELPKLEGSVERVSLNHAIILAELGGP